jgi:hypothetical protein
VSTKGNSTIAKTTMTKVSGKKAHPSKKVHASKKASTAKKPATHSKK